MAGKSSSGMALRGRAVMFAAALTAEITAGNASPALAQDYPIALPDPTNRILVVRPNPVAVGDTAEIVNAVQNKGAGPLTRAYNRSGQGPTLTVRFLVVSQVLDKIGIDAGSWSLDTLQRGETKRQTVEWTVPDTMTPGAYYLCADVDPENRVRESNELNNRTCQALTIEPAPEISERPRESDESGMPKPADQTTADASETPEPSSGRDR